jgi:hypothetical protein
MVCLQGEFCASVGIDNLVVLVQGEILQFCNAIECR